MIHDDVPRQDNDQSLSSASLLSEEPLIFLQIRSNRGSESPSQGKWLSATRLWSKRCWNHSEFSLYLYSSLYFDSSLYLLLSFDLANDSLLSCVNRKVLTPLQASHISRTLHQLFANKKESNSWNFICLQLYCPLQCAFYVTSWKDSYLSFVFYPLSFWFPICILFFIILVLYLYFILCHFLSFL